ncbi:hypothetical protein QC762_0006080 [Podospora pseudocomata]|uniref:Uncharacterized protein n=1 Tax=Podospora pseudocomata TaxID=2093779 RepID=A0ABR0GTV1_9PEZI|nr:hypothetical protein QC762_0006080 [Podospora pseudocomata]
MWRKEAPFHFMMSVEAGLTSGAQRFEACLLISSMASFEPDVSGQHLTLLAGVVAEEGAIVAPTIVAMLLLTKVTSSESSGWRYCPAFYYKTSASRLTIFLSPSAIFT